MAESKVPNPDRQVHIGGLFRCCVYNLWLDPNIKDEPGETTLTPCCEAKVICGPDKVWRWEGAQQAAQVQA